MLRSIDFKEFEKLQPVPVINGAVPICHSQFLMSYPFFSLSKAPRQKPIDYASRRVIVQVEVSSGLGIASIWDADILIWAASRLVHAHNSDQQTSRCLHVRPYDILGFLGRGRSKLCYDRLRHSLDRLQATRVTTTIGSAAVDGLYSFNWIDGWRESRDQANRSTGIDIYLSDWFYELARQPKSCLTLQSGYFKLTGGLERWLYLLARKHAGRQQAGWSFDLAYLHRKSGSLTPEVAFIRDVRNIALRGRLLDYKLVITRNDTKKWTLLFRYSACGQSVDPVVLTGDRTIVLSGRRRSFYQVANSPISHCENVNPGSRKIISKIDSKIIGDGNVDKALEKLSQRPDPMAFDEGMGAGASPQRPSASPPPGKSFNPNLNTSFQPDQLFEGERASRLASQSKRQALLEELRVRKRIPLPGEPS